MTGTGGPIGEIVEYDIELMHFDVGTLEFNVSRRDIVGGIIAVEGMQMPQCTQLERDAMRRKAI